MDNPTIEELEKILRSDDDTPIRIQADGSILIGAGPPIDPRPFLSDLQKLRKPEDSY